MFQGFKLGRMTLKSLFSKPATELYPFQPHEYFELTRGQVMIDIEACISCGSCARVCPTDCLSVSRPEHTWTINRYQCVQCKSCVRVCPTKCLVMEPSFKPVTDEKQIDVYGLMTSRKQRQKPLHARRQKSRSAPAKRLLPKRLPKRPPRKLRPRRLKLRAHKPRRPPASGALLRLAVGQL